jgi:hypothetical protein
LRGLGTWLVKVSLNTWRHWAALIPRLESSAEYWIKLKFQLSAELGSADEESDPWQLQWEAFLLAMRGAFDAQSFTIKELIEAMVTNAALSKRFPMNWRTRIGRDAFSGGLDERSVSG